MTGSVALDVVIGLVFVYSIYSLFTTIVFEMISERIGIRTRMFHYYLKLMLTDHFKWSMRDFISRNQKRDFRWAFLNQPSIRALGKKTIPIIGAKEGASYLTPETFSAALIDLITINEKDESTSDAIEMGIEAWTQGQDVEELLEKDQSKRSKYPIKLDPQTAQQLSKMWEKSYGDVDRFEERIQMWFDATMERCKGGFKQVTQLCLFIVGLVIAVSFNVDTVRIVKLLSKDSVSREALVNYANQADSAGYVEFEKNLNSNLADVGGVLGFGWDDQNDFAGCDCFKVDWTFKGVLSLIPKLLCYLFKSVSLIFTAPGYLVTGLALSLGAPFWFDLLNKLMRLRTSIQAANTSKKQEKIVG